MNLYLISQDESSGYETYDSAVVCAESEDEARFINPDNGEYSNNVSDWKDYYWCSGPEKVSVKFLGKADSATVKGLVLASFNAG